MASLHSLTRTPVNSGSNKAGFVSLQLLLVSGGLLNSTQSFIDISRSKSLKAASKSTFQVLYLLTYLSIWLSHVTMLFLGCLNKYLTRFLIPKILSLAHFTSYILPALTKYTFSIFYPLDY